MSNNNPETEKLVNFEIKFMWADELIGKNSVIPWTAERMNISNMNIYIYKKFPLITNDIRFLHT